MCPLDSSWAAKKSVLDDINDGAVGRTMILVTLRFLSSEKDGAFALTSKSKNSVTPESGIKTTDLVQRNDAGIAVFDEHSSLKKINACFFAIRGKRVFLTY
jgi:hypothetical protein